MMADWSYTIWIVLVPFLAFLITGLFGEKWQPKISGLLVILGMVISTALSYITAYQYFFNTAKVEGAFPKIVAFNSMWLRFNESLYIDMGVLLDPISVMLLVVITTVSLMVFIYSLGYMAGERGFVRYFAFLSLFSFSMLGLVISTNLFQLYMFWELVGVSSYLLIGYYYDKPSAVAASKKAFIVTRFADFGFLIGLLLLSYTTGTFDLLNLTDPGGSMISAGGGIAFMGLSTMTWSVILIFVGGAGKSAMFPLHIWLPDAMEGPTPVSALIHAATMVVAGVYLVARLFPIYAISAPAGLEIIAFIGAFTSLFAAVIACTQIDIKRILAYSTISQIGYMMMALGVADYGGEQGLGFTASMFHLFTHAFFKALLFLCAGAVIHAVHSNDFVDMGGLRKYLPITHITCLIACLSISGIPPFAGFFSKDEILVAAFNGNKLYFATALLVAGLTAFYMFRLYFSVFWARDRTYEKTPHEAPATMTIPLIVLAIGAALAGFVPFSQLVTSDGLLLDTGFHWSVATSSVLVVGTGIVTAMVLYRKPSELPDQLADRLKAFYQLTYHKFYIDEIYLFVTKNILFQLVSTPIAWFDRHVVDGTMNGVAAITNWFSFHIRGMQSGQVQQYVFVFLSGVIALALTFIYFMADK